MPFTVIEGSVLLFDANGNPLSVSSGDPLGLTKGMAVVGSDGTNFRFLRTATDGTVRVDPSGTTAQPVVQSTAANLNATAVQGTAASLAGAWPIKNTDGTNVAAVKAASTAAQASDPSLVVGLSPNSPLPAGSNALGTVTAVQSTASSLNATVAQPTAANLNATAVQGSAAPLAGAWPIKNTDGTNVAAVKAASTPAGATDPSLVVGLSPNSPLPAGTNALGTVTAVQSTASQLNATVVQGTAANLLSQVSQPTAANLNATVVQSTAENLLTQVSQPTAANLNATAVQGTAAALAGAWPVKVTDGTNTLPTGDAVGRAIFQKLTDGTNGPVAVKTAGADAVSNTENSLSAIARLAGFNSGGSWDRLRAGVTAVSSTLTGMLNVLPWTVFNASPTVRTEGQGGPLQTDANGSILISGSDPTNGAVATAIKPIVGSAYSWTRYQNLGASVAAVVKASPGNVYALNIHNNNAAQRYVQLFNATVTPSAGAVPTFTFLIPASGVLLMDSLFFGQGGYYFSSGIVIACSVTEGTYTAGTASDFNTHLMYV